MDVLWPALGIAVVVVFVFFVLAQHWQHLLRQQSRAIRQLSQRVQNLEDMADPELRRRLGDAAPVPLKQVFTFSMRLGERFWSSTVKASDEDRKFIHEYGSFLASVKLERWRSHTEATVSEILPTRKSAGLQTRTLDYYPNSADQNDTLTVWELALARPAAAGLRPPSLELRLCGDALELRGPQRVSEAEGAGSEAIILLRLPLDPTQLEDFRCSDHDPDAEEFARENGGRKGTTEAQRLNSASYWHAFFAGSDGDLGIEWELRLRDLSKKVEWERWHIWEAGAIPVGND